MYLYIFVYLYSYINFYFLKKQIKYSNCVFHVIQQSLMTVQYYPQQDLTKISNVNIDHVEYSYFILHLYFRLTS